MSIYKIFSYTYKIYLIILIVILTTCSENKKNNNRLRSDSGLQQKEAIESSGLLKHFIKDELKKNSILLFESPALYWSAISVNNVLKDIGETNINANELYVKAQKNTTLWSIENVTQAKILTNKDLPGIKSKDGLTWTEFKKKSNDGYYVISHPLFLKDFKYAIIWTEYVCDERCGYGELRLYQKSGEGWKLIKTYSHLIA